MKILFTISGKPFVQKRHRFAHGCCYDPSSKDKKIFIDKIPKVIIPSEPFLGPVSVEIDCYFGGKKQGVMIARPDVDNCAKIILDCMNNLIYKDDSQVVELLVKKFRCTKDDARTEVTVSENL